MKVLVVSYSDSVGGAAIAARRALHAVSTQMERLGGGDSISMVVAERLTDDPLIFSFGSKIGRIYRFVRERGTFVLHERDKASRFRFSMAIAGTDITHLKEFREADVIHLHWINNGFIDFPVLKKILSSGKRIVWTMHDMWTMTGGCHHAVECRGFMTGCGDCPLLKHSGGNDLSARQFRSKSETYRTAKDMTFVPVSRWLSDLAENSPLTGRFPVDVIPNPIDTAFFSPQSKAGVRIRLGLNPDKLYIAFGAANLENPKKGVYHLIEALQIAINNNPVIASRLEVITFGKSRNGVKFPVPQQYMGYVTDRETMRDIYAASDAFAMPSLEDTLPNTVMESLSAGRPVVGFATGGIPYMIEHLKTGYIVPTGDTAALADGIQWIANADLEILNHSCRKFAEENYAENIIGQKLYTLYKDKLSNSDSL